MENTKKDNKKSKGTFEEKLESLDNIIIQMENDELDLEDSIKKYEEAVKLINECEKIIDKAEGKVKKIIEDNENIMYQLFE
ncbi:MAG: exodeoxyribonuclease VII small subunit [Fusobacteria bacterium]|nr:exodeoxyribonuclease VII small subunit [Fusobacteriota bacterium]